MLQTDDSDETLMLAWQAGTGGAFDRLYARHRCGLFRFILRQCRERRQAEELFQDVWTRVIEARARYRIEARFRTWLYTVAHNRLVDHFRRENIAPVRFTDPDELPESSVAAADDPESLASIRQQGEMLLRVLAEMPVPQREAFLMHQEGGLSVPEIAAATGVGVEAAKSRLRYAIARLRSGIRESA
jgi:RNA polymerase sigma factor (sigma-70 family)